MGDIQNRPFSSNYSGLTNQSVIAVGIAVLSISGHEYMKRKRRGRNPPEGLGSRESWGFGYLYQGRSWARNPSPPSPGGWILSWVKQAISTHEDKMLELRGIDATLYVRFLRACFWFTLLHTCTTFPILFPIHVRFSLKSESPKSMTRASISSLVGTSTGLSLLWIHICLLIWVTVTWMGALLWICHGAFKMREKQIHAAMNRTHDSHFHPHPHPQYGFQESPAYAPPDLSEGLRMRTIMVSNVPPSLRREKDLKEYFEYYMSRKLDKPSVGLTSSTQPGFLNKSFAFIFNRAKRLPAHLPAALNPVSGAVAEELDKPNGDTGVEPSNDVPVIERVVIVRKMTELASLMERREDILRLLETAHIKLAKKTLAAVSVAMRRKQENLQMYRATSRAQTVAKARAEAAPADVEAGNPEEVDAETGEKQMERLIKVLSPYVDEFDLTPPTSVRETTRNAFRHLRTQGSEDSTDEERAEPGRDTQAYPPSSSDDASPSKSGQTIWDALLLVPRHYLDAYQPLINLSHIFRGKIVPSIDYYTLKLNYISSLIVEQRAKAVHDFPAMSAAFVTFEDPHDARRACRYLAVHPNNPLACMVTMAPMYSDLDWTRLMKLSFDAEFIKDWVVNVGVWAFTIFWIFPVSVFVGLVSIQNISTYWPQLKAYLDRHPWQQEVIQSFLPTLLVALLALLIPLILLLIAKKAHTITTLSALHDLILTRYYKFLIVNVLVIFCVGLVALQTLLTSFKNTTSNTIIEIVAGSFPTAGPFYVGWMIFTTAMHAGFELALFGLPLILYPATRSQVTPRKRAVGIRPRTLNFYYWLPNHLLVTHILIVFSVLNPLVIPFGMIYFFINSGVIKNQLLHVYAKNYEQNGHVLLIRMVRYSLDGCLLSQVVFLAYMVVLKKPVNVGLTAFMIVVTALFKLVLTRICRAQFEHDDIVESETVCSRNNGNEGSPRDPEANRGSADNAGEGQNENRSLIRNSQHPPQIAWASLRLPGWVNMSYATIRKRPHSPGRQPNPFRRDTSFTRLNSISVKSAMDLEQGTGEVSARERRRRPRPRPNGEERGRAMSDVGSVVSSVLENPQWLTSSKPVVPHAKILAWDDNPTLDLPYENPYYTRDISDVLWLPRNPVGMLDLDDTIDLKASLTTTLAHGQLGQWRAEDTNVAATASAVSPMPTSPLSVQESLWASSSSRGGSAPELGSTEQGAASTSLPPTPPRPHYSGDEEIDLPLVIAKRVQANEGDIEQSARRRPSVFKRRPSTGQSRLSSQNSVDGLRRQPSMAKYPGFRSFSSGTTRSRKLSQRSTNVAFPSVEHELGGIRLEGNHSDGAGNLLVPPMDEFGRSSSFGIAGEERPRLSRAQNITAHEAIVHEVVAEEEHIQAEEEREEEEKNARTTKSWMTSWLYKK